MLDVFKEHLHWNYIMGLSNVGDFNLACEAGHATDLINVAEALQEKRLLRLPMKSITGERTATA